MSSRSSYAGSSRFYRQRLSTGHHPLSFSHLVSLPFALTTEARTGWPLIHKQWCHLAAGHIHNYNLRARRSRGKYPAGSWPESFFVIMGIIDVEAGPQAGEPLGGLLQSETIVDPMAPAPRCLPREINTCPHKLSSDVYSSPKQKQPQSR